LTTYTEYPIVCDLVSYRNLNVFPYSNDHIQAMFLLNAAVSCEVAPRHLARYRGLKESSATNLNVILLL